MPVFRRPPLREPFPGSRTPWIPSAPGTVAVATVTRRFVGWTDSRFQTNRRVTRIRTIKTSQLGGLPGGATPVTVIPVTVQAFAGIPVPTIDARTVIPVVRERIGWTDTKFTTNRKRPVYKFRTTSISFSPPAPGVSVTAQPSTVAAVAAVPAPTVLAAAIASPAAVVAVASVPAPAVLAGAIVAPSTVVAVATVPAPTVLAAAKPTPSTVVAVATVAAPTVLAAAKPTPGSVAAIALVGAPTVRGTAIVGVTTAAALSAVGSPTILTVEPATPVKGPTRKASLTGASNTSSELAGSPRATPIGGSQNDLEEV